MVGHRRRKAQQDVGIGDIGIDQAVMSGDIDGELRKPLLEHDFVAAAHRFIDFGEDEKVRHGASGIMLKGRKGNDAAQVTRMAGLRYNEAHGRQCLQGV
jgi:hypothetical protein